MTSKKGYRLSSDEQDILRGAPTGKRPWTAVLPLVAALVLIIGLAYLAFGFLTWKYRQKQETKTPQQSVVDAPDSGHQPEIRVKSL